MNVPQCEAHTFTISSYRLQESSSAFFDAFDPLDSIHAVYAFFSLANTCITCITLLLV